MLLWWRIPATLIKYLTQVLILWSNSELLYLNPLASEVPTGLLGSYRIRHARAVVELGEVIAFHCLEEQVTRLI